MLSARKPAENDNIIQTYQTYKKWQEKRLTVKEKMKEKLNESLSPLKSNETTTLTRPSILKRDISGTSLGKSSKTPSVKERAQEIAANFSGKTLDMSNVSSKSKVTDEPGKKKFDDLLNNYFNALPSTLGNTITSPLKEQASKSQKKIQTAMETIKAGFHKRSPSNSKGIQQENPKTVSAFYKTNMNQEMPRKPSFNLISETTTKTSFFSKNQSNPINLLQFPQTTKNSVSKNESLFMSNEIRKLREYIEKMSTDEYVNLPKSYQDDLQKLAQAISFKQKVSMMASKTAQTFY